MHGIAVEDQVETKETPVGNEKAVEVFFRKMPEYESG
jgi:hypothetical protein